MSLAYDFKPAAPPVSLAGSGVDATLDLLDRMGVRMAFAKDEEIYGQDEDADLVYRVLEGAVRTTRLMSDGRRQIGDFYRKGDLFGFETGPSHRFSAEALQDTVILVLKRSALKSAGGDLERLTWAANNRELDRAQTHLMVLGRKTACEKVASFLLDLMQDAPGVTVELPMGRQDMADYLGLTIETVSRMISHLQANHTVCFSATRQFRVLNLAALARMAE
jgi:CRP/FNR family nitrogen fixation transcriptional regulator